MRGRSSGSADPSVVELLGELFNQLIFAPTASVKPDYELAKLALDRDEQASAGVKPVEGANATVLGKRKMSPTEAEAMQVDAQRNDRGARPDDDAKRRRDLLP